MKTLKYLIVFFIFILFVNNLSSQVISNGAMIFNNLTENIKEFKRSSVSVEIIDTNYKNPVTQGSGFLVLKNKKIYAVTNYHVVAETPKNKFLVLGLNIDGIKMYSQVMKIIYDTKHDIAVMDFDSLSFSLTNNVKKDTTLSKPSVIGISMFAKNNEIIEGTGVLIVGYPLGIGSEYTGNKPISRIGIVAQQPNTLTGTFIIDGVASHGNSGSPVINAQNGKLLGMICSFPSDFISAYDENGNTIVQLPYNSSLSICVTIETINKLIP